jgi:aryl-alcohol dehydrogenase-like predicted oxidoreductase
MKKRILGTNGLKVSEIGLGCMGLSFGYGPATDHGEAVKLIRAAHDLGVTFFDTAEAYGAANEELVGEALAPVRDAVVIATKFGWKDGNARTGELDSRPERIRLVAEQSLKRLRTDRIDLFYQHRVDPDVPIEDGGRRREGPDCRRQGQAFRPFRRRCSDHPPGACGATGGGVAERVLPVHARARGGDPAGAGGTGHRLRALQPLGKGFLTGKIDTATTFGEGDIRNTLPRFQGEAREANQRIAASVGEIAARKGVTPAQVALAWLLAMEPWIVPIPGTTKLHRLQENVGATGVELTADDLGEIAAVLARNPVQGTRYTEQGMKLVGR